jgi:hypothetical protein
MVPVADAGRLSRGGPYAALRNVDLLALVCSGRGRHPLRSGAQADDLGVPLCGRSAAIRSFNEDDNKEYDVLDYNIAATISPERQFIDGLVRMRLRVQTNQLSSLTLRLADSLNVTGS